MNELYLIFSFSNTPPELIERILRKIESKITVIDWRSKKAEKFIWLHFS